MLLKSKKGKFIKILCYHGIYKKPVNELENYNGKHLPYQVFLKQMIFLKKNCKIFSFSDLLDNKKKDLFSKNSYIISFDDGFKNNFKYAFKILKRLGLKATIFICPGNISKKRIFWVDHIQNLIAFTKVKKIFLNINKKKKFFLIKNDNQKINIIDRIKTLCKKVSNDKKNKIIRLLETQTGLYHKDKINKELQKCLSWSELKKMQESGIFDIGYHSYEHEILSKLTSKQLKKNISKSINIIKNKIKKRVDIASYPEGRYEHFNKNVINILKSFNIKLAAMSVSGINNHRPNLFYLKRYMVGFNGIKFPY